MAEVDDFIAAITDEAKRADARRLVEIMSGVTSEPPKLHGSMIGFGRYHYRYASGHEGDSFLVGFAPRKDQFSIYLMGSYVMGGQPDLLSSLGKHKMGKGCLYVKRLSDVDEAVLEELIVNSVTALKERYPS